MTYFKKFGDFCSGFSAFTALMYLFRQYMMFDFKDEELKILEKAKIFFSPTANPPYYAMLILAAVFVLSVIGGRVFARLPYVAIVFCVTPLMMTVYMIKANLIAEYPMLYAILGIVALISAVADCIHMDKSDGKCRGAYAGDAVSLFFAVFCVFVARKYTELSSLSKDGAVALSRFENDILANGTQAEIKLLYILAALYVLLTVVSLILRDIYFIDALLCVPPATYLIYMWGAQRLTLLPEILVTLALAVVAVRMITAISGRAHQKG